MRAIESEPSSINNSRRITLSRVVVLPEKLDAAHIILLLFVEAQRDINYSVRVINVEFRLGREINKPETPIFARVIL